MNWVTRVPMLLNKAKEYHNKADEEYVWYKALDARYQTVEIEANNTWQRWVLVKSEPGYQREYKALCKKMEKAYKELEK